MSLISLIPKKKKKPVLPSKTSKCRDHLRYHEGIHDTPLPLKTGFLLAPEETSAQGIRSGRCMNDP